METIFLKISGMIKRKEIKQYEIAEQLGVTASYISAILKEKIQPNKTLIKLAEMIYGNKNEEHPNKRIQAILKLTEDMDGETLKNVLEDIEKEKLFFEMKKQKMTKKAA